LPVAYKEYLNDYSKNHKLDFKKIQQQIDKLKALMHPVRYAIVVLLVEHKKMTVTDIYDKLSMKQAAVSNHLRLMKDSRILLAKRDGKKIYYSVNDKVVKALFECLKLSFNDE